MVRTFPTARAAFSLVDLDWVAVQIATGRVEIYRVEDGLEMFQGYADDRNLPLSLVVGALSALARKSIRLS